MLPAVVLVCATVQGQGGRREINIDHSVVVENHLFEELRVVEAQLLAIGRIDALLNDRVHQSRGGAKVSSATSSKLEQRHAFQDAV